MLHQEGWRKQNVYLCWRWIWHQLLRRMPWQYSQRWLVRGQFPVCSFALYSKLYQRAWKASSCHHLWCPFPCQPLISQFCCVRHQVLKCWLDFFPSQTHPQISLHFYHDSRLKTGNWWTGSCTHHTRFHLWRVHTPQWFLFYRQVL